MWSIRGLSVPISLRKGDIFHLDRLSNVAFTLLQRNPKLLLRTPKLFRIRPFHFQINKWELDHYSRLLAEKWVEEIGLHYSYYVSHIHPPSLLVPPSSTVPTEYRLTNKRFSGDVSGVIGEVLYLAYIEKVLELRATNTLHLRPYKGITADPSIKRMADFYTISHKDLQIGTIKVPANSAILGEAKACTNPVRGYIKKTLDKAYSQIKSSLNLLGENNTSPSLAIISLAMRDFKNTTYKLFVIILEV